MSLVPTKSTSSELQPAATTRPGQLCDWSPFTCHQASSDVVIFQALDLALLARLPSLPRSYPFPHTVNIICAPASSHRNAWPSCAAGPLCHVFIKEGAPGDRLDHSRWPFHWKQALLHVSTLIFYHYQKPLQSCAQAK